MCESRNILQLKLRLISEMNITKNIRICRRSIYSILTCILMCTTFSANVKAETVSQKEAAAFAELFFNAANGKVMSKPKMVYNGRRLTTDRLFSPFYLYTLPTGGYVVISAENKAFPILAYSLKETFNPDKINDAQKALLAEYARDIEYIRYNSDATPEAFYCWTHPREYIDDILRQPARNYDIQISDDNRDDIIDRLLESDDIDLISSDIYTPEQWREILENTLRKEKNVTLGIIGGHLIYPAIIHGVKGEYFNIYLDNEKNSFYRLMATEVLSSGQLADITPTAERPEPEDEKSFEFYDSYIADMQFENSEAGASTLTMIDSDPQIRNLGSGHFEIVLPENVDNATIYNISGARLTNIKFHDTNTAVINMESEPRGFYVAQLRGNSGKTYGIKLYR